jgi:hypothetical protein
LGISQPGQFQGSFGLVVGKSTIGLLFFRLRELRPSSAPPPNHLVPVFLCEKALNIKNILIKIEGQQVGNLSTLTKNSSSFLLELPFSRRRAKI